VVPLYGTVEIFNDSHEQAFSLRKMPWIIDDPGKIHRGSITYTTPRNTRRTT
jgi:hypothetical protein